MHNSFKMPFCYAHSAEEKIMKFITQYSMPIAAVLLLAVFYLALPELKTLELRPVCDARKRLGRIDALIMAVISLVYAALAFYNLGDRQAPQSFANMECRSAEISLSASESRQIMLYTGIGIGSYTLEYAPDGETYTYLTTVQQSHADDLKWHSAELACAICGGSIRISGSGNVWLGELVVIDGDGLPVPISSDVPELCDEQMLYQLSQNFMNSSYFDEIYHARTAWEHLNRVYPYEITHPPLGKLIISVGIGIFGMTPFGWRFSGTLFGVLMLPFIYVFIKKLFGGRAVPTAGTIVFASDFMHFVQTRIATIDTYAVFFTLLMYLFMYLFFAQGRRLYLALSGVFFGVGAACKWTCFYAGAGLALLWLLWVIRSARTGKLGMRAFVRNVCFCIVFFVVVPVLIYSLSYYPYALAQGNISLFSGDYFRLVWSNQEYMFNYHSGVNATHPYSSRWYQWILDIRPILYYLEYLPDGTRSSFGAWLNPALCWGGLLALFALVYLAVFKRDGKAIFILIGYLAQLLPWVFVTRITFEYHYFACTVFLTLALSYIFDIFRRGSKHWQVFVCGFASVSVLLFAVFYPALSGRPIEPSVAKVLIAWLPSWPF